MKIISIDLEATHHDSSIATMLEFAAVGFDISTDFKPVTFHKRFTLPRTFEASLGAMVMNADLLKDINDFENNRLQPDDAALYDITAEDLLVPFFDWATTNELCYPNTESELNYHINVVGKNFAVYDKVILSRLDSRWSKFISRRIIDIAGFYILPTDKETPNTRECRKRSGLFTDREQTHNALEDAMEVALMAYNKLTHK